MKYKFICSQLVFTLFFIQSALSQVSLSPTTVFIDQNGIGTIYVTNGSAASQEVNISFIFGYPGNDSLGNISMVYQDSLKESIFGLGERIRSFPRSFTLQPTQQQTVRFQVRPDKSTPPGMYFTRVKVTSNEQTPDVSEMLGENFSTRINFKFEQVIAAFYKQGEVSTGLEFSKIEAHRKDNSVLVYSEFRVSGNSPYLGSLQVEVKDGSGKTISTQQQTLALYFEGKRNFTIPIPEGLPSGSYQINLVFKTERSDIPTSDLVQAPPISKTLTVVL